MTHSSRSPSRDHAAVDSIRWGLCCLVVDAPLTFRSATHAYVTRLSAEQRLAYLDAIALANTRTVVETIGYCARLRIGAFRITSQLFPLATHPLSGFGIDSLPGATEIRAGLATARRLAEKSGIRLSFHPDQFIVLNSARPEVVDSAIAELEWQGELAELLGADVICLHGGSTAGGRDDAIDRLVRGIDRVSERVRSRLALENDDRCYPVVELLPACLASDVPLVLDAHHHRVLPGDLSLEDATDWAVATWGAREPYFHLSSPRAGWGNGDPRPHADFIDAGDVPSYWLELGIPLTVDVEAKAKERAVLAVREAVSLQGVPWRMKG
jgi:UV DNA damage endonuclease